MLPTLLQLGPIRIASFSVFMLLAFLVSTFIVWRLSKREYLDEEKTMDIYLLSVIWGMIGARLSYVLLYPDKFGFNLFRMVLPTWMPGFYIYGGVIAGILGVIVLSRKKEAKYTKYLDTFAPAFILAVGLYKIGQFLDGSLIGTSTNIPYLGLPVAGQAGYFIPLALFQAVAYFITFYLVNRWSRYFLITHKYTGGVFLSALVVAGGIETISYFFTRDKLFILMVPLSLAITLSAFIFSSILLYKQTRSFAKDRQTLLAKFVRITGKKSTKAS